MVTLEYRNGSKKEYETLTDVLRDNPEIEEAALICRCRWKKTEEYYDEIGIRFEYAYDEIDWGWSFIGPSDGLKKFARRHDEWSREGIQLKIEDSTLTGILEDWEGEEWTAEGTPHCGLRRCSTTSAERVKLTAITLPSGKRFSLGS